MTEPNRTATNRANAKSPGAHTPEGKARSSRNARKQTFHPENFAVARLQEVLHLLCAPCFSGFSPRLCVPAVNDHPKIARNPLELVN